MIYYTPNNNFKDIVHKGLNTAAESAQIQLFCQVSSFRGSRYYNYLETNFWDFGQCPL